MSNAWKYATLCVVWLGKRKGNKQFVPQRITLKATNKVKGHKELYNNLPLFVQHLTPTPFILTLLWSSHAHTHIALVCVFVARRLYAKHQSKPTSNTFLFTMYPPPAFIAVLQQHIPKKRREKNSKPKSEKKFR